MMTALIGVPLMFAAGGAIDYTNMTRKSSQMQDTIDAALLYVAQDSLTMDDDEVEVEIRNYLQTHLSPSHYLQIKDIDLSRTDNNNALAVNISAEHPTNILGIAGFPALRYNPVAEVRMNGKRFEIAMVLDSTFSMSADGKMDGLKTSATSFVNQLMDLNTNEEKVKIGIVPFARYVNVGVHNRHASWLDAPDTRTENICRTTTPVISSSGCSSETRYNDGVPYQVNICTSIEYGDPVETCSDQVFEWTGCVGSREYPLNVEDRSYATRVPGLEGVSCPTDIQPLTASRSGLLSAINNLTPSESTYIPAGLTWGLRTLSSVAPITGGKTPAEAIATDTNKMVILMTDGENVLSVNTDDTRLHTGNDVDEANTITLETCDEIKEQNIVLYTIGFGDDISSATETMLKNCSTGGISYFRAQDSNKLAEAFDEIAAAVTAMYLSK